MLQVSQASKGQIRMTLKSSGGLKANKNVLDRLADELEGTFIDSHSQVIYYHLQCITTKQKA